MKSFKGTIHTKIDVISTHEDGRTHEEYFSVALSDELNRVVMEPIFVTKDQALYEVLKKKYDEIDEILSEYYLSTENKLMSLDEIKRDISSEFPWLVGLDTYELHHQIRDCEAMINFYDSMTKELSDPEILDEPSSAPYKLQEYKEGKEKMIREINFIKKLLADRGRSKKVW